MLDTEHAEGLLGLSAEVMWAETTIADERGATVPATDDLDEEASER